MSERGGELRIGVRMGATAASRNPGFQVNRFGVKGKGVVELSVDNEGL